MVPHDRQRVLPASAGQTVRGVRQPVEMQGSGHDDVDGDGPDGGQHERQAELDLLGRRAAHERADQRSHEREADGPVNEIVFAEPHPPDERSPGEKGNRSGQGTLRAHGEIERTPLGGDGDSTASSVAMSRSKATLDAISGRARVAPLPSPSRMSRLSSGCSPSASRTRWWPGSAER